jgi:SNF2-related domain
MVVTYRSPTKPKAHQLAALAACRAKPPVPCPNDVFAYLMDMGTGKSKVVLDEWGHMATNGGPRDLLVIAPKGSVRNWYEDKGDLPEQWSELRKHVDPEFLERLVHHTWVGGGVAWEKKMRTLLAAHTDKQRPRALFVNVEALSHSDEALKLCLDFVIQRGAHVVVDESTTIKGDSSRTEAAVRIGEMTSSKRILSGLWTPKSPLDLYYQCQFLDQRILGQTNFFTFKRRYAILQKGQVFIGIDPKTGEKKFRKFDQVVGYRDVERLQERVGKYSYRVLKKDCLDLEPKVYTMRDVELTPDQKRMLRELKEFGFSEIRDDRYVTTDMVIKQIIRELQICCGYVMDDERVLHEVKENRTAALLEILEEHNGKAIIWCPWRAPLQKIVKRLSEEFGPQSVAQFHGGNVRSRGEEEKRFLSDPECLYMVDTQGAGMRGNTWVVADLVVYYANNYDLEQRDQSEDRAHRIGQTKSVTYVDLVAQGTREMKVIQALRKKIDLATLINKEGYRAWTI